MTRRRCWILSSDRADLLPYNHVGIHHFHYLQPIVVGYNYLDRKLGGVDEGNKRYQEDSIPITMDDYVIPGEVRLSVGKGRGSTGTAPSITDSNQYRNNESYCQKQGM